MAKKEFTDHETQLRKLAAIVTTAIDLCMKMSKDEKDVETQLLIHKAAIVSMAEYIRPIIAELAEEERVTNEQKSDK